MGFESPISPSIADISNISKSDVSLRTEDISILDKHKTNLPLKGNNDDVSIKTMNSNFRKGLKEILWEHLQKNDFY